MAAVLVAGAACAHDARVLGDGRVLTAPKRGHLYSCQQRFSPNAPGTSESGPWIRGDEYFPSRKPTVAGSATWPDATLSFSVESGFRIIRTNGLPTHATGTFPVSRGDIAFQYDRNPNRIQARDIVLRLPVNPEVAAKANCVPMGMIGVTVTGVALFNALDARGRDAAAYEVLDRCHGHPQQQGQYHYHDFTPCLPDGADANGHSLLLAYALDGFGVYGPKDVGGRALTNADLDDCHGHVGPVMWDGKVRVTYHYHFNDEYPYSVGCFRGTPWLVRR